MFDFIKNILFAGRARRLANRADGVVQVGLLLTFAFVVSVNSRWKTFKNHRVACLRV